MELITASVNDGILTLAIHGRIDSTNAPVAEQEVVRLREENPAKTVIVDADDLAYISSAGLRVILRLRKDVPDMKIINASNDVYEIFEMTGFTEMIPVEKGYRHLSVEGCEVIGKGANGEVYRLDPDTIIKVYLNPDSLPDIHRERELARRAFVLGVPTAIPYDVVKVGAGYGSVFELLNAKSFAKILGSEPERFDEIVGMFVDLLKKIHATTVRPEDMPDMKQVALKWAGDLRGEIDSAKAEKLIALIDAVPESHQMMHGDYHMKNVMLQNGEAILIDMDTLSQGNPVFEFASVFNAFVGFGELDHEGAAKFQGLPYDMMNRIYEETLRLYFGTDDKAKLDDLKNRFSLVGYTRLLRRTIRRGGKDTDEGRKLVAYYKEKLESLIDKVETLAI